MARTKKRRRRSPGSQLTPQQMRWQTSTGAVEMLSAAGFRASITAGPAQIVWRDTAGWHSARLSQSRRNWFLVFDTGQIPLTFKAARELGTQPGRYVPAGKPNRVPVRGRDPVRIALMIAEMAMRMRESAGMRS